ncbi:MAG: hypothetical protein D6714_12690 [Bacteroidetes bacterium]|nr:MAG: hypothetical protein D6714_12690 [Bacteroidota bacterium]
MAKNDKGRLPESGKTCLFFIPKIKGLGQKAIPVMRKENKLMLFCEPPYSRPEQPVPYQRSGYDVVRALRGAGYLVPWLPLNLAQLSFFILLSPLFLIAK